MKKKIVLLIFSILFSIILIEILLNFNGKYKNLTNTKLIPSDSIYERPSSSIQKYKHPDLNYIINNYFDEDGVKNFTNTTTSNKRNIIGFFGDSFVENIAIPKEFEYSNLINRSLKTNTVVNYGVGGYSADQVFLRFIKYKNHDFKHVFYFYMLDDDVLKTNIEFLDNQNYKLNKKKINKLYQFIGKLNITYFLIESFYVIRGKLFENHTTINKNNFNSILANKIHSKFYSKNYNKFYSKNYNECKSNKYKCEDNFIKLLSLFKKEVEKTNSSFHILLYPNENHIKQFKNLLKKYSVDFDYHILDDDLELNFSNEYNKYKFKNDKHWNEYGNILFAKNILSIFNKIGIETGKLEYDNIYNEVDQFYKDN